MKKYKNIFNLAIVLVLSLINFACSNVALKDGGAPKKKVNSYYSENGLPQLDYKLSNNPPYFKFVNDTDRPFISGENESDYLKFYKDKTVKGYGSGSSYWRWEITYTQKQMDKIINNNLYSLGRENPRNVYRLQNRKWVSGSVPNNPVGTVKELKVLKRGTSGVVLDLYIKGSKGEFVVTKENRVRRVLSYSKKSLAGVSPPVMIGKTGKKIHAGSTLFPSGFFALEKNWKGFTIYGGGFGHGIGLPQVAVKDLVNKGADYKSILKRYYKGIDIKNTKWISGVKSDIKVGITRNSKPEHPEIILSGDKGLKIKSGFSSYNLSKGKKVKIIKVGKEIRATVNGKIVLKSNGKLNVSSSGKIRVNSITRALKKKYPEYRGTFEICSYGKSLLLINTVNLEQYLMQVVGSEMPISYGLEALKVQAVAARTYAVEGMQGKKYKNFDVVDTIASQVYNNLDEADVVNRAISATKGEVMTYNGKVIPAYFYSTSGGYSATPMEIW